MLGSHIIACLSILHLMLVKNQQTYACRPIWKFTPVPSNSTLPYKTGWMFGGLLYRVDVNISAIFMFAVRLPQLVKQMFIRSFPFGAHIICLTAPEFYPPPHSNPMASRSIHQLTQLYHATTDVLEVSSIFLYLNCICQDFLPVSKCEQEWINAVIEKDW